MMGVKGNIDFLIVIPPAGAVNTVYPPYGAMYVASALRKSGYSPGILNVDAERISNAEVIKRIKRLNPRYIGFSGIVAPSYSYIKELSLELRKVFPDKTQILGGGLTSATEPILKNTSIDIVVIGEGEITAAELISCLTQNGNLDNVYGIAYRKGLSVVYTAKRDLIRNLDTLPYPAFDLVDMSRYMPDGIEFIHRFIRRIKDKRIYGPGRRTRMMTISTSRGCFGECSFCFRAYRGIRIHSMKYVFDLVGYCMDKFGVRFFSFGDECFAHTKARNWEFIEEFKRRKLDIIFRILGMRVDTVDREIIRAFKEIGCWMIEYGFESGSQKMLNIMNKGVTVEQNRQAFIWTRDEGIFTAPALVLAMPGETDDTIKESIDFIKSLNCDFQQYQCKFALPIPGSALYDYAKLTGAIEDEDKYLSSLAGKPSEAAVLHANLTAYPDNVVIGWHERLNRELDSYYFTGRGKNLYAAKILAHYKKRDLLRVSFKKIKVFFYKLFKIKKELAAQGRAAFRKQRNISVEDFIKGLDCSKKNREMSLKIINKRLHNEKVHKEVVLS